MDRKDDLLKVRVPSELKEKLREIAEDDPETGDLSKWIRRELRVALRITRQRTHDDER